MDVKPEDCAKAAYLAFSLTNTAPRDVQLWETLSEDVQQRWFAAARAAVEKFTRTKLTDYDEEYW